MLNTGLTAFWVIPEGMSKAEASRVRIFRAYVGGHRLLEDLASAPPWDLVASFFGASGAVIFALGMLRVFRMRLIVSIFGKMESDVSYNFMAVRMGKFLFMLIMESHLFACIFIYLALDKQHRHGQGGYHDSWMAIADASKALSGTTMYSLSNARQYQARVAPALLAGTRPAAARAPGCNPAARRRSWRSTGRS